MRPARFSMAAAVFLRLVLAAVLALATLTILGDSPAQAAGYRVVGTGDSILVFAYGVPSPGGTITSSTWWLDVECGRNAYTAGLSGRASTASIWPLVLSRSMPGGWIIIQDNALGVTDAGWRSLMQRIVNETPDDRCLLGVLPAFRADVNPIHAADAARRATIMKEEFRRQPCSAFVRWDDFVAGDPGCAPDGQHPDPTGQAWLRSSIAAVVGRVQTVPSAPMALTATVPPATGVGSGQARLAWKVPTSTGGWPITDYLVQRSTNGLNWTSLSDGLSTNCTYTVSGLTNEITYRFRVAARTSLGWGPYSNVVTATPHATVPSAPRWPSAVPGRGTVWFSWSAPASTAGARIDRYVVERWIASAWVAVGSTTGSTGLRVNGLTNGISYGFRIRAHNAAGYGPATSTIWARPGISPSAPTSARAVPGNGTVWIDWIAPASNGGIPVNYYAVEQWTGSAWTRLGTPVGNAIRINGLTNGTSYAFRVRAHNAAGFSASTPTLWARPTPPTVPAMPTATPMLSTPPSTTTISTTPASTATTSATASPTTSSTTTTVPPTGPTTIPSTTTSSTTTTAPSTTATPPPNPPLRPSVETG